MIQIAIIEDNDQFRTALETIIQDEDDFKLMGTYTNAEKALQELPGLCPDIIIADISLPGISGIELIIRLRQQLPNCQFMVCSIHDDNETIFEAMKCGATGYIHKELVNQADIVKAIHDLHKGGSPMSPFIARKVMLSFQHKAIDVIEKNALSLREKEVLEHVAKGLLYKEIAEQMGITRETVKKHLKNIYQKLHVQNKIEALNKFKPF